MRVSRFVVCTVCAIGVSGGVIPKSAGDGLSQIASSISSLYYRRSIHEIKRYYDYQGPAVYNSEDQYSSQKPFDATDDEGYYSGGEQQPDGDPPTPVNNFMDEARPGSSLVDQSPMETGFNGMTSSPGGKPPAPTPKPSVSTSFPFSKDLVGSKNYHFFQAFSLMYTRY